MYENIDYNIFLAIIYKTQTKFYKKDFFKRRTTVKSFMIFLLLLVSTIFSGTYEANASKQETPDISLLSRQSWSVDLYLNEVNAILDELLEEAKALEGHKLTSEQEEKYAEIKAKLESLEKVYDVHNFSDVMYGLIFAIGIIFIFLLLIIFLLHRNIIGLSECIFHPKYKD